MRKYKLIVRTRHRNTKILWLVVAKNEYWKIGSARQWAGGLWRALIVVWSPIWQNCPCDRESNRRSSEMADVKYRRRDRRDRPRTAYSEQDPSGRSCVSPRIDEITVEDVRRLSSEMENILVASGKNTIIHVMRQDYTVRLRRWNQRSFVGMSGTRLESGFP